MVILKNMKNLVSAKYVWSVRTTRKVTNSCEMKFADPREYFQKLHNILSAIVVVPVLAFGFIYLEAGYGSNPVPTPTRADIRTYIIAFATVALVAWSIATFLRRLKEIRQLQDINERLSQYANATITRFAVAAAAGFTSVIGLYLTNDPIHVGLFVFLMIMLSAWWPSPSRLSRHLRLKKEEREWVMRKG